MTTRAFHKMETVIHPNMECFYSDFIDQCFNLGIYWHYKLEFVITTDKTVHKILMHTFIKAVIILLLNILTQE